jgi:hypothetical protein
MSPAAIARLGRPAASFVEPATARMYVASSRVAVAAPPSDTEVDLHRHDDQEHDVDEPPAAPDQHRSPDPGDDEQQGDELTFALQEGEDPPGGEQADQAGPVTTQDLQAVGPAEIAAAQQPLAAERDRQRQAHRAVPHVGTQRAPERQRPQRNGDDRDQQREALGRHGLVAGLWLARVGHAGGRAAMRAVDGIAGDVEGVGWAHPAPRLQHDGGLELVLRAAPQARLDKLADAAVAVAVAVVVVGTHAASASAIGAKRSKRSR